MGILSRLRQQRAVKQTAGNVANPTWIPDAWLRESPSGIVVTDEAALGCSTVFACARAKAEDTAARPLVVYERLERGRRKATEHPVYPLLHDAPNRVMTAMTFREAISTHIDIVGRAIAWIQYSQAFRVKALWLLRPDRVRILFDEQQGRIRYFVRDAKASREVEFEDWEILHFPGLGFDGVHSFSPVRMQMNAIGLALATEEHGGRLFGNGVRPGGVFKHPKGLSEEAYKRLMVQLAEGYEGLRRSGKSLILEEGLDWQTVSVPNDEAQFLETRKFQVAEIARWYRMPLHKVQDLDRATFSNIEHQSIGYVTDCILPHATRMEQEYNRKLFSPEQTGRFYVEHNLDALLRGDSKTRNEALEIRRRNGVLSANEWRELENQMPLDGDQGDTYIVPANMIDLERVGQMPVAPIGGPVLPGMDRAAPPPPNGA